MFLQGNGYKLKETHEAMKVHEQFRVDYLGENNEKVNYEEVADLLVIIISWYRILGSFIFQEEINILDLFWSLMLRKLI